MKLLNTIRILSGALFISLCCLTASCNFLEIVPVEQADLDDATQDFNSTLGFLHSCYAGIQSPVAFENTEASADEYAVPLEYSLQGYNSLKVAHNLFTGNNNDGGKWSNYYRYIGQIHLFLQELKKAPVSDLIKEEWEAEAYFLMAYYHFEVLRCYGPCPISDRLLPQTASENEYPGRMHYDYVTDWIVRLLDEKVLAGDKLRNTRSNTEVGRATRPIALALKAKVLLYAASPLWNGKFPYPEWKNVKLGKAMETPGYGTALVSTTYDREKWVRAEEAAQEALNAALDAGHYLFGTRAGDESLQEQKGLPMPYIPNIEGTDTEVKAFQNKVLTLRYMMTAKGSDGNLEILWELHKTTNFVFGSIPNNIMKLNNGSEYGGWSSTSPYLYAVEHFYTNKGTLPKIAASKNEYPAESKWLDPAGVTGRSELFNICVAREPRFYAWLGFHQGDYSSRLANGQPIQIDTRDPDKQGYNPAKYNRNHLVTGFAIQKFLDPNTQLDLSGGGGIPNPAYPLIRMADLYLMLAECQANLSSDGKSDTYVTEALKNLNAVHQRAGLKAITKEDLTDMPLMEWIKNERYVEFYAEGQRYFDVRRWVEGGKYLAAGKREGLRAEEKGLEYDEFRQRIKVNQPYEWNNRQYILPIYYVDVNSNPQLVQAPGYGN